MSWHCIPIIACAAMMITPLPHGFTRAHPVPSCAARCHWVWESETPAGFQPGEFYYPPYTPSYEPPDRTPPETWMAEPPAVAVNVPEPSGAAVLGLGLIGVGLVRISSIPMTVSTGRKCRSRELVAIRGRSYL
jgi:hypothetical protein